jgi:hypothetical protein
MSENDNQYDPNEVHYYWLFNISVYYSKDGKSAIRPINMTVTTKNNYVNAFAINNALFMTRQKLLEAPDAQGVSIGDMIIVSISPLGGMSNAQFMEQPVPTEG